MGRKVNGGKGFRRVDGVTLQLYTAITVWRCNCIAVGGSPRWEGRKETGVPETNSSNQYFQFQEKVLGVPVEMVVR